MGGWKGCLRLGGRCPEATRISESLKKASSYPHYGVRW